MRQGREWLSRARRLRCGGLRSGRLRRGLLRGWLRRRFLVTRVTVASPGLETRGRAGLRALMLLFHGLLYALASFLASLRTRRGEVAVLCALQIRPGIE